MAEGAESGGGAAGQPDAVLLAPLSEDSFLHNLHVRYKRDIIYTYVGNALVSVNPCRALPLYSAELVRAYLARPPYQLPPHLYAIAATAYRWVRDRNESQCIVMTGESGAGKTEAARVCLQCAVVAGEGVGGGGAGAAGGALTAAGTLLEAFGNAATARNHNASRFGKLLEIEFDFKGEPIGGHITHYLLEKERAYSVCDGERSFHVLYQLLAGADVPLLKRLKLQRSWEQYRILRGASPAPAGASPRRVPPPAPPTLAPPAPHAAAQHDIDHFAFTKAAMATLGFGGGECSAVLRLLAFLLKLGNVQFEPQHNIDGTIGTRIHHLYELREACALVGVDAEALAAALAAPAHPPHLPAEPHAHHANDDEETEGGGGAASDAGSGEWGAASEDGEYCGDAEWGRAALERLLGALYSRLFTWLVHGANAALKPRGGGGRAALGVLDVYGLESLARNGLERLLINYAAERVQAAVTGATLRREQEEYAREGLAWRPLAYADHEAHADLLDAGPESLLGALRELSARAAPDAALLARLARRRQPRLRAAPPDGFTVLHFGGPVAYCARGMLAKNRDALCRRCGGVLARARDPLLAELFAAEAEGASGGAPPSPRRPAALSCRQRALVAALVRRLPAAPRLVRCLRADAMLRPHRFDAQLLRHQIRTQGILEMALLRRAGWCESMCARAVVARYGLLAGAGAPRPGRASPAPPAPAPRDDPVRAARALLRTLPIPSAEFAYGRTKVFIRSPRTVWELEALRAARVEALVVVAQRAWRRHRARAGARERRAAQCVIARAWRAHRARRGAGAGTTCGPRAGCVRAWAARAIWRWWCAAARRRYLLGLWARLPARHRSPACGAWPPVPAPRLLGRADALLRRLHHSWRCREFRAAFDQTARNRMREKVTASALFRGRKATYAGSVAHPFVGDYVRLRASAAWRRGAGAGAGADRYVVFADAAGKVARASGRVARCLCVVSTAALLLLEARSLRVKRRVPAHAVYRLSLSPHADDVLVVHVRPGAAPAADEAAEGGAPDAPGCLFAEGARRRRGDVVLRTCHVLELATKLFLVVQNAVGAPPHVNIATEFEANFGAQVVTIAFHALEDGAGAGSGGAGDGAGARLLRRADRMDVLL